MATRPMRRWPSNRFTRAKQWYGHSAESGIQDVRRATWYWERRKTIPVNVFFRLDGMLRGNRFAVKYPEFC